MAQSMVDALKEKGIFTDARMEAAFRSVPRHLFLPDVPPDKVYSDEAIPVKRDPTGAVISSSSQPSMMILMLNQLQLRPGDKVLEIGTATGYNAAIMQYIVGDSGSVTSMELDPLLAKQARDNLQRAGADASRVHVVEGDGVMGYPVRAAYDRIIATVGVWDVPAQWVHQLKPDGILVAPISVGSFQLSAAFTRQPDGTLYSEINTPCGFVSLRGAAAGPLNTKRLNSSSLTLTCDCAEEIDTAALHSLLSEGCEDILVNYSLSPSEYWYGFFPYLMLHEPQGYFFALYGVEEGQQAYGLEGGGFVLFTKGSASFMSTTIEGATAYVFGSADSLLALQDLLTAWDSAGRPDIRQVRLRLIPVEQGVPAVQQGKLFLRRDHYLHVWMD
jgi:protein-L-isoaspartate(D-aspartate) O-methyltransferase